MPETLLLHWKAGQLSFVPKVKELYEKAVQYGQEHKGQLEETHKKIQSLSEVGKELPTL